MPFQDRFVLCVYLGLADTLPVGRDAVARLFDRAFTVGRLAPAALSDTSVLLLLVAARPGSTLRQAAEQEAARRGLQTRSGYVWGLLESVRPLRLTELLELNRTRSQVTGTSWWAC